MDEYYEVRIVMRQRKDADHYTLEVEYDPEPSHLEPTPSIYIMAKDFEAKLMGMLDDTDIIIAEPMDGPEFGGPI